MPPYRARLIRASNAGPPKERPVRAVVIRPLPPPPPAGYVYYSLRSNTQVLANLEDGRRQDHPDSITMSLETRTTCMEAAKRARPNMRVNGVISVYHDRSSEDYDWLMPGWIAEKRIMPTQTCYWLFYDPSGKQYKSKKEVTRAMREQD